MKIKIPESVIEAVLTRERVEGAPHDFYRYPARFSPLFAREVIRAFTSKGDVVVDPFCGSGTTAVEAISLGRRAIATDVNALAVFLARTKTSALSSQDKRTILEWLDSLSMEPARAVGHDLDYYARNLPAGTKAFFESIVAHLDQLPKKRQRDFARLALLSVGQSAVDCKTGEPTWATLHNQFVSQLRATLEPFGEFLAAAAEQNGIPQCRLSSTRRIFHRSSEFIADDRRVPAEWLPAKLVCTSPPYPGVHVLYHRWQIRGRKETPAPYWLANQRDGAGMSFYTLGSRHEPELKTYYSRLLRIFKSVNRLLDADSIVVQLVAFGSPDWQLPAYLRTMEEAGFAELEVECPRSIKHQGRLWREVPGRKWYANKKGALGASREVLLIHRPSVGVFGMRSGQVSHGLNDFGHNSITGPGNDLLAQSGQESMATG